MGATASANDQSSNDSEDDEEWLPPPRRRRPGPVVIIGVVILMVLAVVGGVAVTHGFGRSETVVPTPTTPPDIYGASTPWIQPGMLCNEAVQKIEQNQIAFVLIYRQKEGGPAIPANAITTIEVLPRGIAYQGDPAQSVQLDLLGIYTTYPDHVCFSQLLAAVKQINKHLRKREQVKVGWYYD